jgi:hypothetical protein
MDKDYEIFYKEANNKKTAFHIQLIIEWRPFLYGRKYKEVAETMNLSFTINDNL